MGNCSEIYDNRIEQTAMIVTQMQPIALWKICLC